MRFRRGVSLGAAYDDVVDGYENQFDGVPDEAHDGETDGAAGGDFLEFLSVGLGAPLEKSAGAGGEFLGFLDVFHRSFTGSR